MKSFYKKTLYSVILLCVSFASFADIPDPNGDDDLNPADAPVVPINTKLIWLAIVGIAFVYYQFNIRKKKSIV